MKISTLCLSSDGKWAALRQSKRIIIKYCDDRVSLIQRVTSDVSYAFFNENDRYLFAVTKGYLSGIILFKLINDNWKFLGELQPFENLNLINPGLKKVFLDDTVLTFVYNNRLRIYDTNTGKLKESRSVMHAPLHQYTGGDISWRFRLLT
ncbi:MAG: hypothetical protein IJH07_05880 [Ruminococcus sp.]|nr:hypothetical protein [Ruminococcus sp.]